MAKRKKKIDKNESLVPHFIKFRKNNKDNPEATINDFYDSIGLDEDLRSDFCTAALFTQVQEFDKENGKEVDVSFDAFIVENLQKKDALNEVIDEVEEILPVEIGEPLEDEVIDNLNTSLEDIIEVELIANPLDTHERKQLDPKRKEKALKIVEEQYGLICNNIFTFIELSMEPTDETIIEATVLLELIHEFIGTLNNFENTNQVVTYIRKLIEYRLMIENIVEDLNNRVEVIDVEEMPVQLGTGIPVLGLDAKKIGFWRGCLNLFLDGTRDPDAVRKARIMVDNPITFAQIRMMTYKDLTFDVSSVNAFFYREQDSQIVIRANGQANITREYPLEVFHKLKIEFLSILSVMAKVLNEDKYGLDKYVITDKCILKRKAVMCSQFKRGIGAAIIDLKSGSHVNLKMSRREYNKLQIEITKETLHG